jgi:hypothetical protein
MREPGQLPDAQEIEISSGGYVYENRVAFCGTNYFVTWVAGPGYLGVHVSPDGVVLDPTPIVIAPANVVSAGIPNVSPASNGCFVAWVESPSIKGRALATPTLLDSPSTFFQDTAYRAIFRRSPSART